MKKLILYIATFVAAASLFTSCLKDGKAEADLYFFGETDSIKYDDPADSVFYKNICNALDELGVTGQKSLSEYKATNNDGSQYMAMYSCYQQADTAFQNKLKSIDLKTIKKTIFNQNADSLIKVGYANADSIPLDPFSVRLNIVCTLNSDFFNIDKKIY